MKFILLLLAAVAVLLLFLSSPATFGLIKAITGVVFMLIGGAILFALVYSQLRKRKS